MQQQALQQAQLANQAEQAKLAQQAEQAMQTEQAKQAHQALHTPTCPCWPQATALSLKLLDDQFADALGAPSHAPRHQQGLVFSMGCL